MRIVCPKCETEYALDATQLSANGTPVQCSACEHTFTAYPDRRSAGGPDTAPVGPYPTAARSASTSRESFTQSSRPSSARSQSPEESRALEESSRSSGKARTSSAALGRTGDAPERSKDGAMPSLPSLKGGGGRLFLAQGDRIYKVKDTATLQRWVVEKRVLPNDRLSRDGKSWDVVSSVPELRPFFTVLDQLNQTKKALTKARKAPSSEYSKRSQPAPNLSQPSTRPLSSPAPPAEDDATQPPGTVEHSQRIASERVTSPKAEVPTGPKQSSRPSEVSESVEELSPPELPAAQPAHLPPGAESFAAQEERGGPLWNDDSVRPAGTVPPPGSSTEDSSGPDETSRPPEGVEPVEEPSLQSVEELSSPELSAEHPDHSTPGSESLAAQEESGLSLSDDGSPGTATSEEAEEPETEGFEDEAVQPPDPMEDSQRIEEPMEGSQRISSERVTSPQAEVPTRPNASSTSSEGVENAEEPADGNTGFADSFFGSGVQPGETGGVTGSIDDGPSDDASAGDTETRAFGAVANVETSEQLPGPQSLRARKEPERVDFDPDQTFEGLKAVRPSEGAGGAFYATLVLLVLFGLLLGWYLLLGPGQTLVFGDPNAAVTLPQDRPPVGASVKDNPAVAASTDASDGEVNGDGQAEVDPGLAAEGEPTPEPASKPAPKAASKVASEPAPKAASRPAPKAAAKPASKPAPKPPKTASALKKAGDRARDRGDFRGAVAAYRDALELSPSDVTLHTELGWSYIELSKNADAATHFSRAIVLAPQRAEAHYGLGLAYQSMGRRDQAITEYRKVIELDPNGSDTPEVKALLRQLE